MDFKQIFLIFLFLLTIACIIKEPTIKLGKRKFKLDYGSAPVIAVLILSILGYFNLEIIKQSLIGIDGVVPWQVILIFFTGAYICITIDSTGIFEYFSFKVINWSKGNTHKLFFGVILISAILTIFTSNDIVILSMTPIICYMAKHSRMNPLPYLFVMFFSANAWSMFFYIGNPPNIIVAQAFNLSFIEYAKLMFLPTLVAGISTSILTYFVFRKELNKKIIIDSKINPQKFIRNKNLAILNVCIFILFFIALTISEYIGLKIWQVMLVFFVIFLAISIGSSFYYKLSHYLSLEYHYEKTKESMFARNFNFKITEFNMNFERVPWKMLPLVLSLFMIVHLFNVYEITSLLTAVLNYLNNNILGSIIMPFVSAICANLMVNQAMTILFANVFNNPNYIIEGTAKLANGLGLVIGTNLGGNLTLFGALAGLLWKKILFYNGIKINYFDFLKYSLRITPFVILFTSLALLIQITFLF